LNRSRFKVPENFKAGFDIGEDGGMASAGSADVASSVAPAASAATPTSHDVTPQQQPKQVSTSSNFFFIARMVKQE
jgi:hypothetical protein